MTGDAKLRIRNWKQFQQYKDRCPPWIKLHRELLQSEDWVLWDDASRVLAIACMLLASRTSDGTIPANPSYIKRAAYLNSEVNFAPLISCGFLELQGDSSIPYETLASCTTETETETEREPPYSPPSKGGRKRVSFVKPTAVEVQAYLDEIGERRFSGEEFVDGNEAKGWLVGKTRTPMKDWKAAVRTWRRMRDGNDPTGSLRGSSTDQQETLLRFRASVLKVPYEEVKRYFDVYGATPASIDDLRRNEVPF